MPPPRKLKTQKKARPESCLLYWGCRRTRNLDRKLFREDCEGTAGFCRIGAKRRPCPQQPASSNSQPPPDKKVSWIPPPSPQSGRGRLWGNRRFLPHLSEAEFPPQRSAKPSVAAGHGAFVGEPQVPAALERSGIPARRRLTSSGSQSHQTKKAPFWVLFVWWEKMDSNHRSQ